MFLFGGINAAGQVVGTAYVPGGYHAFLWSNGRMQDLGTLPGGSGSVATGIADGPQTVFLIHGIAQSSGDLDSFAATLRDPGYGIDQSRFIVDSGFDFGNCAAHSDCPSDCTIGGTQYPPPNNGAKRLAAYINQRNPIGDIIIIGYSMGGLIARDMILHDYDSVITNHHVAVFITLGTPHLGYAYEPIDGDPPQPCSAMQQSRRADVR